MGWFQGAGMRGVKWAVVAAGLLASGCVGAIGAGAAVVVIGAGIVTFTCYDRVSVTVTDRVTGTKLCDAKVTFIQGKSETAATSCYQAALSAGKYTMRVERPGLQTFEEPVEVSESDKCGQSVQTMYVALDRLNRPAPPTLVAAPSPAPVAAPAHAPAPTAAPAPAGVPPAAAVAPPPPAANPGSPPLPPPPAPPPAATAFPDAPSR
jgi:hypothetical protein